MSTQTEPEGVTSVDKADNQFEDWAQSLSEFVIRTVVLPVTLLMTKPSAIAQGSVMRRYRPLPSPFLLAVVMGIVISGVAAAVITAATTETDPAPQQAGAAAGGRIQEVAGFGQRVLEALAQFYGDTDGMRAVLFALPFVAFIWIAAGLTSAAMFRGVKNVNAMFAGFSLSISAIIEVAAIATVVGLLFPPGILFEAGPGLALAFAIFAIVIGLKVLRLIFVLRKEHRSSWIGAVLAVPLALIVVVLAAGVGGGTAFALIANHNDEPFERGHTAMSQHRYTDAIEAYTEGLRYRPDHYQGLNWRAEASLAAGYNEQASEDANTAIRIWEGRFGDGSAPSHFYATRAAILSDRGDHEAAEREYTVAFEGANSDYERAEVLAGRCRARIMWGAEHLTDALADCNQSIESGGLAWEAREARGIIYLMTGQRDLAEQDFQYAKPFSPFSQFAFGALQRKRGEVEAGEDEMVAAFSADMRVGTMWTPYAQYLRDPGEEPPDAPR